jgi:predicted O-methyltransferase YrrM
MGKPPGYVPSAADLDYIDELHGPLPAALADLEALGRRDGIPIVDRATGRALAVLATDRTRILEIGTAYGYSTLWMALAMNPGGRLVTIDPDEGRTDIARGYWRAAGVPDERVEVINRPALDVLRDDTHRGGTLGDGFELVFIDALKEEYIDYLEGALPRCAGGTVIAADNVLWGGHVAGAPSPAAGDRSASATEALRAFNRHVLAHARLTATILPVGDGLLVAVVRP